MLEGMNGMRSMAFIGRKIISFSFGLAVPFTFPSKDVAGSAAQFNSSVSIAPPSYAETNNRAFSRRRDGYTA